MSLTIPDKTIKIIIVCILAVAWLPKSYSQSTNDDCSFVQADRDSKERFEYIFWRCLGNAVGSHDLIQAYKIYEQHEELLNQESTEWHREHLQVLKDYDHLRNELLNSNTTSEDSLYYMAIFQYRVSWTCWLQGELRPGYHKYLELLHRFAVIYPQSEYRDNVEWLSLMVHNEDWQEAGSDSWSRSVGEIDAFLSKYPQSDVRCEALIFRIHIRIYLKDFTRQQLLKEYETLRTNCSDSTSSGMLDHLKQSVDYYYPNRKN